LKAIILAAGEGNRMRPLTSHRPKVMLPLANKPILEHLLLEARAAGISDFILVVGYGGDQVRDYFGDGKKWGVSIAYCEQRRQAGTADAIGQAGGLVTGNFLAMNGDVVIGRKDIKKLAAARGNTMSVIAVADPRGLGIAAIEGDKVVGIYEKTLKPPSQLANAGLYLFTPEILDAIARTEQSPRGEYEITDSLKFIIATKAGLRCHRLAGWLDVSYPWDLITANEGVMAGMKLENLGQVEPGAVLKGAVDVGKDTIIRSGAYIEGPVVIGESCDIGPNCYIRPATAIGDGCRIGAAVEVKNSIIMNGTKIPHHNYVGDSVIGESCNLGAGTKIANLRLDKRNIKVGGVDTGRRKLGAIIGDGVETGINCSINVGTIIGGGSCIGPGAVVSGVVLPGTKLY